MKTDKNRAQVEDTPYLLEVIAELRASVKREQTRTMCFAIGLQQMLDLANWKIDLPEVEAVWLRKTGREALQFLAQHQHLLPRGKS